MCLIDDEDEEVVALPVHVASKLGLTSVEEGGGGSNDGKGLGNLGNLEMMMWMMMTMMVNLQPSLGGKPSPVEDTPPPST